MPPPPPRIRLFGPISINTNRVGAPKLACVLAALALRPGTPVAQTELIDRVWDGDPPDAVLNVLYSYVARLRTALKSVPGAAIRRAGSHGYVLDIEPRDIDLYAARALREEALTLSGSPALEVWRRACELAGDEALVGLSGQWADNTRAALAVERLELLTERYAAELDAGHHTAVLSDLAALSDAEPLVESLAELLMLAYYRSGRPADALTRFEAIRVRLRDELGADPSQRLRDLHLRILDQDPQLDAPTAPAPAPIQLPSDISGFTGRTAELKMLDEAADVAPLAAVVGPGGAGKTALAVRWGHSSVERFPGGLLYVNLRGFDEGEIVAPREALSRLLVAMNMPGQAVPEDVDAAADLFRSVTADSGVLVILDNARSAEQVRPLLPGAGCFTIVTSRDRLTGLIALNDARLVPVGTLGTNESVQLLARILGPEQVQLEQAAVQRLAELCGQLALALRIAAAHIIGEPSLRIADYVAELERRDRLDVLTVDGDPAAAVTANLAMSYRVLDDDARELFARLGSLPGEDFAEELIVAVSGRPEADTLRALRRLVAAHLVEQHRARRYRMHDLVRLYAARAGAQDLSADDRATGIDRFIEWHHDRAYRENTDEETNIFVACEALQDHPNLWRLVFALRSTLNEARFVGRLRQHAEVATQRAAESGDELGQFRMMSMKANLHRKAGDTANAIELGTRALAVAGTLTHREQTAAGGNLGIYLVDHGDLTGAAAAMTRALDLAIASGNTRSQQIFTSTAVRTLVHLGRFDEGTAYLRSAEAIAGDGLPLLHRIGYEVGAAELQLGAGEFDRALETIDAALAVARQQSHPYTDMWCLNVRGRIHRAAGRPEQARDSFAEELRLARVRKLFSYEPESQCDLADALVELGDHRWAAELLAQARRNWPDLPRGSQAFLELVQAGVHNGLAEYDAALAHATVAADIFAAMPWPARHELALLALADAHAGLGDTETAREHRALADQIAAPINRLRRRRG
ncbi:BTAD domain-containing putative transcriptional regulator [Kribbella albertanoniae]|uniref:OmpR/PhoB-type domain-containing protein n=1 Tax=Kribbella albertanoniae TaxID=1266829 RepID=A0A4R4QBZ9_9ACTN|nr:BTAD domain-containing putative transcriptional regulator [Kribbella albertanoniae]TDC32918.1 hypothetical protein E1261_07260 [Kribbella albertanoniae]